MITCSRKMPLKWNGHTWAILFFVISYCPMLWGQTTEVSLGDDFIVGEGETFTLHAEIALPATLPPGSSGLVSSEATYSLAWFERTIDETNYPDDPFVTTTLEAGAGTTSISEVDIEPIEESTYYKVVLTDAAGVSCEAEVLRVRAKLKKVLFHNSLPLFKDPVGDFPVLFVPEIPTLPDSWHWNKDDANNSKPIWYSVGSAGSTLKASALLELKGATDANLANLKIRATGNLGFELTTSAVNLSSIGNPDEDLYISALSVATQLFPNNIAVFENFELNWQFTEDDGANWKSLSNSTNTFYISRTPLEELVDQIYFHTTVHLSCIAAQGSTALTTEQQIVNNIYKVFTTKDVKNYSGDEMSYWGYPLNGYVNTMDLLRYKDGFCGAWSRFFVDMLCVQGIVSELISVSAEPQGNIFPWYQLTDITDLQNSLPNGVTISSSSPPIGCFLVNWWEIIDDNFYGRLSPSSSDEFYTNYNIIMQEPPVSDPPNVALDGVAAQSNPNPRSRFYDHNLVRYNNAYYDPSYGSYAGGGDEYNPNVPPFISISQWEDMSINAIGATFGLNGGSNEMLWIKALNTTDQELLFQTIPYNQ